MKQNIKNIFLAAAIGGFITVTATSCKKDDPAPTPTPNVVQLAQSDTTLSLLVTLVTKAGLASTLSTTNNITVFAPTNAAFRAAGYPDAVINGLTDAQAAAGFTSVLTYHVVGAKVLSTGVPVSDTVKTLNGKNIFASKNANGVFVNGKKVIAADLNASNGVVHKINGVLLPPTKTIAQIVTDGADFSTLEAAVTLAGLAGTLNGPGKFTVFAPDNAAFVTSGLTSLAGVTPAQAGAIVGQHAFTTNIFASDLTAGTTGATVNPTETLTIALSPVTVKVTGGTLPASGVTATDIVATNGVVHVINRVLLKN